VGEFKFTQTDLDEENNAHIKTQYFQLSKFTQTDLLTQMVKLCKIKPTLITMLISEYVHG